MHVRTDASKQVMRQAAIKGDHSVMESVSLTDLAFVQPESLMRT